MTELPPATCPAIERLRALARRHTTGEAQLAMLAELEWLREAHLRLRAAAAGREPGTTELLATIRRRGGYEDALVEAL